MEIRAQSLPAVVGVEEKRSQIYIWRFMVCHLLTLFILKIHSINTAMIMHTVDSWV